MRLETLLGEALRTHFAEQAVDRYGIKSVNVRKKPRNKPHPAGLDGYKVSIGIEDRARPAVKGLPAIKIDIAAPEELGEHSVGELEIAGHSVIAYREPRLIGEKLRAFLSSLPEFRRKSPRSRTDGPVGERIRVKDVFDIAVCESVYSLQGNDEFWAEVMDEFVMACRSRGVDCEGLSTFEQKLAETRQQYEADEGLQSSIEFEAAWKVIQEIVTRMEHQGVVPLEFPLPPRIGR